MARRALATAVALAASDAGRGAAVRSADNPTVPKPAIRIQLAREALDAFMRGDVKTALAPASEDVVSVRTAPLPIRRPTTDPRA